ncbi:BQ2448_6871 [Microbotryum intermedium]|uniref:DNA-directed RNA polymerase n=1 Tax=Microbotryum intermedium TaxID=269621 RepID=A0A238FPC3_9BASI|nr:BQ2448_6871 [Microbotryum intermedium]
MLSWSQRRLARLRTAARPIPTSPSPRVLVRFASSSTTRFSHPSASVDPSSSFASSFPPPPPPASISNESLLRRSGHPLYSVPPLPPLAPPLPADVERAENCSSSSSSTLPTPANWTTPTQSQEQLAVLNACLASGDVTRAEEVARRILAYGNDSLTTLLPPRVHADFLRAYLSSALIKALVPTPSDTPSVPLSESVRSDYIVKAWSYFDSLQRPQWWDEATEFNLAINEGVMAVMFKGLVAAGPSIYNPTLPSPTKETSLSMRKNQPWLKPLTTLLDLVERHRLGLKDILNDTIWHVELPSYLGKVTPLQVLDALVETGKEQEEWKAWEEEIEELRNEFQEIETKLAKQNSSSTFSTLTSASAPAVSSNEPLEIAPTTRTSLEPGGGEEVSVSLKTLRTNLSTLGMPDGIVSPANRQRLLEESSYDAARQLYIHEREQLAKVGKDKEGGLRSNWLQGVMFEWTKALEAALNEQFYSGRNHSSATKKGKKIVADIPSDATSFGGFSNTWNNDADIEPFLRLVPTDKMALITIVELLRHCGSAGVAEGMKAARGILEVGRAIENEYHAQVLQQSFPRKQFLQELEQIQTYGHMNAQGEVIEAKPTRAIEIFWRRELAKREKNGDTSWRPAWTRSIHAKVGSLLITTLMQVAQVERTAKHPITGKMVTEVQPAFSHSYQYVRGKRLGVIKVNPAIAGRIDSDPLRITLHPRFLPMVVKPKPWLSYDSGAYLIHSTQMMRTKDSDEQVQYLKQASDADNLDDVFTGLDVLGSVSWVINRPIFDIVSTVWNTGEALGDIPAAGMLNLPIDVEKPTGLETDLRALDTYRRRIKKVLHERRAAHSNRCDINYKLEIARAFLGEKFYFPHNLDFRGRAYPIPPNLSHIGDDMCRGLLMFGEAKPLGDRGLRWLKIHLANTFGYDKASFDEREAFAMEHLDDIYDSADTPLKGKRWWLKAEDPWQCLATCMELAKALRSPNPTDYECALPIHQDGTCNGLQHYAALGGDLKGAEQVNLDGGDRPADVYSAVANSVNEVIERDAAQGLEQALILQGKVSRKVVKQTVMTTVYGVTFIGAKNQIERQLKDRGDISAEHLYACSVYLGKLVLASISDVFKGATAIQEWLSRSARLISKSIPPGRLSAALQPDLPLRRGRPYKAAQALTAAAAADPSKEIEVPSRIPKELMTSVVWTTPLGLPVVQPYRKDRKRQVTTALQTVFISDPAIPAEVDARAQATAFPPNFIHSLDATHMMMTALASKDKIAFASVHDSYWTHACSVDEMSVMLREAFIELHSQDILGKLRQEFLDRYKGHVIPVNRVPRGLRYAEPDHTGSIQIKSEAETTVEPTDLITELEAQDGPSTLPLFTQHESIPLPITTKKKTSAPAVQAAEMWKVPTSRGAKSKFVYVSDVLPPVPEKGDFDLAKIRSSLYFFS